jgi:plastocyanin
MTEYASYSQQQAGVFSGMGWSKRKGLAAIGITLVLLGATIIGVMMINGEAANQDSAATAPAASLDITAQASKPSTIRVVKGQSVVWQNLDSQNRNLKLSAGDNPRTIFENNIGQGETYAYVFDKPGTYNYYDGVDPTRLSGVVIVE